MNPELVTVHKSLEALVQELFNPTLSQERFQEIEQELRERLPDPAVSRTIRQGYSINGQEVELLLGKQRGRLKIFINIDSRPGNEYDDLAVAINIYRQITTVQQSEVAA